IIFSNFLRKLDDKNIFYNILEDIKNIGSYGISGGKRVFVNYNKERKVSNRKAKEKKRSKQFYAEEHEFSTENNKCPDQFINKIICDDSEDVLKELPDNCIDLILTSPPYNFGLEYDNNDDSHYWETYFEKIKRIFSECIRVLKYGGRFVLNVQPLFSDYIPTHHIFSNFFMENKMIWKGEILWEKNNYNCKYTAWGSWKSPSSPYLKYTWEFIEIFCKGDLKKPGPRDKIDITAEEFKEWVVGKWSIAPERRMKEYGHPAMFPEELARRVLKLFSYQDDIILDPFNGAGTTTVVAKKNNRRYIGIDISEEYCKVAQNRIDTFKNEGIQKSFLR
ncbi:MAG TPA: site-specific DNA-methyltransferase, partial [Thermoanaerobacterales bacterium]|nr:site-specific DNA-methyltransferase [Thermoanaerobacterales bacterium]